MLVDFQGREVTKPGDDFTQIRLLALTTYIPSYAETNAAPKHESVNIEIEQKNAFIQFLAEFSRKFGIPLTLKFAFREDGHVIRTLAELKSDNTNHVIVLVSSKPDIHILTRQVLVKGHRRTTSNYLTKKY